MSFNSLTLLRALGIFPLCPKAYVMYLVGQIFNFFHGNIWKIYTGGDILADFLNAVSQIFVISRLENYIGSISGYRTYPVRCRIVYPIFAQIPDIQTNIQLAGYWATYLIWYPTDTVIQKHILSIPTIIYIEPQNNTINVKKARFVLTDLA